ncbi:MAG: thiamine phosphate synthase, partial [Rhodospirillaceae bacterium]
PPSLPDLKGFADMLDKTLAAAAGCAPGTGVACLQIRLKAEDGESPAEEAEIRRAIDLLQPICHRYEIAVILNDLPDLAAETGCDGVHVGQGDAPYAQARNRMGDGRIVGVTCHDSRHLAMEAGEAGADYVAFGAFFPTTTKAAKHQASLDLLSWWNETMVIPSVAIGGITLDNAAPLVEVGADFLAVSAGVWAAPTGPVAAVEGFSALFAAHP